MVLDALRRHEVHVKLPCCVKGGIAPASNSVELLSEARACVRVSLTIAFYHVVSFEALHQLTESGLCRRDLIVSEFLSNLGSARFAIRPDIVKNENLNVAQLWRKSFRRHVRPPKESGSLQLVVMSQRFE